MRKIIFLFFLSIVLLATSVSALTSINTVNTNFNSNTPDSTYHGFQFQPNSNQTLLNVTIAALDTASECILRDNSNTNLSTSLVISRNASFNYALVANTLYRIVCGSVGATMYYHTDTFTSVNGTYINFTNGIYDGNINNGDIRTIESITTNVVIPSALSVSLDSPASGFSSSNTSVRFNSTVSPTNFNITNTTLYIWNSTSVFNQTFRTLTGNVANSTSILVNNFRFGSYIWNVYACGFNSTTHLCTFATNTTFTVGASIINTTYNNNTYPGASESFISNVQLPQSTTFSANLVWNGTPYTASVASLGSNQYTLSRSIIIPNSLGTIPWYWDLDFGTFRQNLTTFNQQVLSIGIDNCAAFTKNIFNFTLYDEDLRVRMNGTIEVSLNLYNSARTNLSASFNKSYTVDSQTTARVCMNQTILDQLNSSFFSTDYQVKYYQNATYTTEYKFGQNISIGNTTALQNINLYLLLESRSTPFTITLENPDLSLVTGAVIDIQRQYLPINQFLSVEGPVTDVAGSTIGHLVAGEVYYNFVITKNGQILGTFNNYLVQCQNPTIGDCRISLNLIESVPIMTDFENYGNISLNFVWNQTQRELGLNFISTDSLTHLVNWTVYKLDNWGNTSICSNSGTGSIGSFSCTIPSSYGNSSIYATVYSDGNYVTTQYFSNQANSQDLFGGTKVVLAILMYTTLALMLIYHPVIMVIGGILGMIAGISFYIIDGGSLLGNSSIVLWFIVAGIIIIHYMRNRNS